MCVGEGKARRRKIVEVYVCGLRYPKLESIREQ